MFDTKSSAKYNGDGDFTSIYRFIPIIIDLQHTLFLLGFICRKYKYHYSTHIYSGSVCLP
jgi:hypothetical protein